MGFQYKFSKILTLKEQEKDEAVAVYMQAVNQFESVANKLYKKMKKKEDLEAYQAEQLKKGLSVQEIRHQQTFIANLEKSIHEYQRMVMNARNKMEFHRQQLLDKNIEVKKYSKLKQRNFIQYVEDEKQKENKYMDEVSIQQFVNRTN